MELTLKQYADSLGLSYEAVRSSFNLHQGKDLIEGEHYRKNGRAKILTDSGISVMNGFRQKAVTIMPGDLAAMTKEIADLKDQIRELEAKAAALEDEKAYLSNQIADLTIKLNQRNDALIEALYRLQEAQGRLLTAAEEPKKGFFTRLFKRG